jgi:hypothetical protein
VRWKERKLYRYRPDDAEEQQRSSHRITKAREQELREIGDRWDQSLRQLSGDEDTERRLTLARRTRRRRRHGFVQQVLDLITVGNAVRRRRGHGRGRHGRRRS